MSVSKSICCISRAAHTWIPGTREETSMSDAETNTVSIMVPMVIGTRSQRALNKPKMAAVAKSKLRISRVLMRDHSGRTDRQETGFFIVQKSKAAR